MSDPKLDEKELQTWCYRLGIKGFQSLILPYAATTVIGAENIPNGPVILAGNHPNILDGMLLALNLPRPVRFLMAKELTDHPIFGQLLLKSGGIPVDRSKGAKAGNALQYALQILEHSGQVGIFPEGKTNQGGELLPFKRGVALMALKTGAPIIPFGVAGTELLYHAGKSIVSPGSVVIQLGQPISVEKVEGSPDQKAIEDVLRRVEQSIRHNLQEARIVLASRATKPGLIGKLLCGTIMVPLSFVLTKTALRP